uniref:Uncharacterized protein n=1 Tax=Rhizophora mucronata TaxID=61149 RepID=A0A2P2JAX4_RHIMU
MILVEAFLLQRLWPDKNLKVECQTKRRMK